MDKVDKGAWVTVKGIRFWGSLVLTAASGLVMLQTPLGYADSSLETAHAAEWKKQVTFYVQPSYQSDSTGDWQAIPGVRPIKMIGTSGETFQVPVYQNFVPTANSSHTVPVSDADLKHPLLLKYRKESTGQYTGTINISYVNQRDSRTMETDTKTVHYGDRVTIRPKEIQGYQAVEASFESPYFTKSNDQSVNFLFKELRDFTYLVKFWYKPLAASQSNQPGKAKETQLNQAHEVSTSSSRTGSNSKSVEANNQAAQNNGDSKPSNVKVIPPIPANGTHQAPKGVHKADTKAHATDNQSAVKLKEPAAKTVGSVPLTPAATKPDLPALQETAPYPVRTTQTGLTSQAQLPTGRPAFVTPVPPSIIGPQSVVTGSYSPVNNRLSVADDNQPTTGNKKVATKAMAVYAIKAVALYSSPNFKPANQRFRYPAQKRYARPMFVVTGYARSESGRLRYRVRDVNHHSRFHGTPGYLTANWAYVRPVYYGSRHHKVKVINPTGVHAYQAKNLIGKVRSYKFGQIVSVKGIVHYHLTTRFILADGSYLTANRKLVSAIQ